MTAKKTAKKVVKTVKVKPVKIPKEVIEAVELGIAWLDLTFGERRTWLSRIDLKGFNIEDVNTCVAGNVFEAGMQDNGYEAFREAMQILGVEDTMGFRFGFNAVSDSTMQYLQDYWLIRLKQMQKKLGIIK